MIEIRRTAKGKKIFDNEKEIDERNLTTNEKIDIIFRHIFSLDY